MLKFAEDFAKLRKMPKAKRLIDMYERGYITLAECLTSLGTVKKYYDECEAKVDEAVETAKAMVAGKIDEV